MNQDTVGDAKALQLENARLQRELAKREVTGGVWAHAAASAR